MAFVQEWVEKVKVVTPGLKEDGPNWKPTSNERNNLMLKEARTYSWALIALHRDLTNWDKNVKVSLNSIANLLKAPLPRVFDEAASGAAFPVSRELRLVASDVPTEVLGGAAAMLREKLSRDVLKPLEQWLEAFKKIREDNEHVEELRAELDQRRRSTAHVQYKVDKLVSAVNSPREAISPRSNENETTKAEAKAEAQAEKLEEKTVQLATEEDKTIRMAQRYADAEAHVFQAVYALIQDGAAALDNWKSPSSEAGSGLGVTPSVPLQAKSPLQGGGNSGRIDDSDGRAQLTYASPKLQQAGTPTTPTSTVI